MDEMLAVLTEVHITQPPVLTDADAAHLENLMYKLWKWDTDHHPEFGPALRQFELMHPELRS